jgi:hypothetical protein
MRAPENQSRHTDAEKYIFIETTAMAVSILGLAIGVALWNSSDEPRQDWPISETASPATSPSLSTPTRDELLDTPR